MREALDHEGEALGKHGEEGRAETGTPTRQGPTDGERRNAGNDQVERLAPPRCLLDQLGGCVSVDGWDGVLRVRLGLLVHELPPGVVVADNTGSHGDSIKLGTELGPNPWHECVFSLGTTHAALAPLSPSSWAWSVRQSQREKALALLPPYR